MKKAPILRLAAAAAVFLIGMTSVCFAQTTTTKARRHAPEIDPASATNALALLTGGLLIIRGRRR